MSKSKVIYFLCVAAIITTLLNGIKVIHVSGISMMPTLEDNTYGVSVKASDYNIGDIVVADEDGLGYIIKRVIGTPGDHVVVSEDGTFVNGISVTEEFQNPDLGLITDVVVPDDTLFIMGDNRFHSTDSRTFGPVPMSRIKYKLLSTNTMNKTEYNFVKIGVCVFVIFIIYSDKVFERIIKKRRSK